MEALYIKYRDLIHQQAYNYSRKYNVPVDDLISAGHEIFVDAVASFEPEKASFCTHLFHQLRALGRLCKRDRKLVLGAFSGQAGQDGEDFHGDPSYGMDRCEDGAYGLAELMIDSKHLSNDANCVMEHLFAGDFDPDEDAERQRLPNQSQACRVMRAMEGWTRMRTIEAWKELRDWYLAESVPELVEDFHGALA